jgi:cytochrome c6
MKRRTVQMMAALLMLATTPAWSGDALRGAELYRLHCSACHGPGGRPVLPTAPDFTQHTTLLKPDLALLASIRRGRGAMPAYEGVLRDAEILDVVAHLRTLRK